MTLIYRSSCTVQGQHYQYPNNDPEFFNGHSTDENQPFQSVNGDHDTGTCKYSFVYFTSQSYKSS